MNLLNNLNRLGAVSGMLLMWKPLTTCDCIYISLKAQSLCLSSHSLSDQHNTWLVASLLWAVQGQTEVLLDNVASGYEPNVHTN